jgi:hypothetical protein
MEGEKVMMNKKAQQIWGLVGHYFLLLFASPLTNRPPIGPA